MIMFNGDYYQWLLKSSKRAAPREEGSLESSPNKRTGHDIQEVTAFYQDLIPS